METPKALLKFAGKLALNALGLGMVDELVSLVGHMAKDANAYFRGRDEADKLHELEALAQAPPEELQRAVAAVVEDVAADQPPSIRQAVADYLSDVPGAIRDALRREEDPTGTSVPSDLTLLQPADLLSFLPSRVGRPRRRARPTGPCVSASP